MIMAKLYFYYSAMNAGKTTSLLQSAYNYYERGMRTLILTPALDNRYGEGVVASRIGLKADARRFGGEENLLALVEADISTHGALHCVFVDEAQFLTRAQVWQISDVVDRLNIPVLAFGLPQIFAASCSKAASICWRGPTTWKRSRPSATPAAKRPW